MNVKQYQRPNTTTTATKPTTKQHHNSNTSHSNNIRTRKISTMSNISGGHNHGYHVPLLPRATSSFDFSTNKHCFAMEMAYSMCGNSTAKQKHSIGFSDCVEKYRSKRLSSCSFDVDKIDRQQRPDIVDNPYRFVTMTTNTPMTNKEPLVASYFYPTSKMFSVALEVLNRRCIQKITKDESDEANDTWHCDYHWEYKGKVTAGQQLCISCRDVGKARSMLEKYYMDTVELKCERSILCHGCMGHILKEQVGDDCDKLQMELTNFQKKHSVTES